MKKIIIAAFALLIYCNAFAQTGGGTHQAIDLEFEKVCMYDSISATNKVQFWRLWNINTGIWKNVDLDYQDYTIVGTVKTCESGAVADILQLCDIDKTIVSFSYPQSSSSARPGYMVSDLVINPPLLNYINAVSLLTIDCGQGQIYSGNLANCECNYNNVPDDVYKPKVSVNFKTGGTRVFALGTVVVRDGNLQREESTFGADFSESIVKSSKKFLRKFNQDQTYSDFELDGRTPYTPEFEVGSCDIDHGANDVFTPSTRPDLKIVNQECWRQDLPAGTYFNWEYTYVNGDSVHPTDIFVDGDSVNMQGTYKSEFFEENFFQTLSSYFQENGYSYHSINVQERENGDIQFNITHLTDAVTEIELKTHYSPDGSVFIIRNGFYTKSDPIVLTEPSSLYFDVNRFMDSGKEALVIDAYGNETVLNGDAYKVQCGGGSGGGSGNGSGVDPNENCLVLGIADQDEINGLTKTYDANTINSLTFTVIMGEIDATITENGQTKKITYGTGWTKTWTASECKYLTNLIEIDATRGIGITAVIK